MSTESPPIYLQRDTGSSEYTIHGSETSETIDPFQIFNDRKNTITSSHIMSLPLDAKQQALFLDPRYAQANAGLLVTQSERGNHFILPQNFNNATHFGALIRYIQSQYKLPKVMELATELESKSTEDLDYVIQLLDLCRFGHTSKALVDKLVRQAFIDKLSASIQNYIDDQNHDTITIPFGNTQRMKEAFDATIEQDISSFELFGSFYGKDGFVGCWQGNFDKTNNIKFLPGAPELAPLGFITKAQKVRIDHKDKTYGLTLFYVPGKLYKREEE